jgi:hypothetical protein
MEISKTQKFWSRPESRLWTQILRYNPKLAYRNGLALGIVGPAPFLLFQVRQVGLDGHMVHKRLQQGKYHISEATHLLCNPITEPNRIDAYRFAAQ